MNKRTITFIVIASLAFIALIVGGVLYQYYSSLHKVTVTVKNTEVTADIYKRDPNADDSSSDTKIATVKGKKTLELQPAKYYAVPRGDKYDKSQISFEVVDKDINVVVDPGFSKTYLSSLLQQELSSIKNVITTKYAAVLANFTLNDGQLYEDGTWYGTTLVQKATVGNNGDTYRTVLHKVGDTWQFAVAPMIFISAPEHKDVPESLLKDLNNQSGY